MSSSHKSNINTNSLESTTHKDSPLKKMKISRSDETLSQMTMGKTIIVKNYELFREIGRGAFASVYLGKKINSDELFAIKSLDKLFLSNTNKTHSAFIEKEILRIAKHDSIIKLFNAFQTSSKLFFVLEYQSNGSLQSLIDSFGSLSYRLAKFYLGEIVNVLDYLHNTLQVIHLDLKSENILLDEDYHLKLIDFGCATIEVKHHDEKIKTLVDICNQNKSKNELVGTPEYCSPEMLNQNTISRYSNDIWAFGCLMYLLFHGKTPFVGYCESETLANIKKGKYTINENLPDDVKDLLKGVLEIDQAKRLTLEQIKKHDFFKDVNFDTITTAKVPIIIDNKANNNILKASKGDSNSTSGSWVTDSNGNSPNEIKEKNLDKDFSINSQLSVVLIESHFDKSSFVPIQDSISNDSNKLIYEGIVVQVNWFSKVSSIMKLYSNKELIVKNEKTNQDTYKMNINSRTTIELLPDKKVLKIIATDANKSLKITSSMNELLKWKEVILSCII